ncbi:MAG: chromosomal replication initiator protein DnaA [Solirubrobacteraceae bacterium]
MTDELAHSWRRIRAELRTAVTDDTWDHYLDALDARRLDGSTLVVTAPDASRAWVTERFGRVLQAGAQRVLGQDIAVRLVGPDDPVAVGSAPQSGTRSLWTAADVPFNARFTFDQFVIGDSNRLAHGAALAVAEMPALAYNPLFICGPPGLGKTHLLHSIANYVAAYGGGLTVRYTTVEAFTNHFIGALHHDGIDAFKSAYRDVGVLLVDDVQFLQRKAKTEEEFFHTFNALHAAGAQIVLTSDRLPRDMAALEDRLRERFEAGLVCDVRPPDYETRVTILRKRVQQDGVRAVEPAALETIAGRVDSNIRALEGALIRTVAFGSLTGRAVTAELAEEVLGGLYPDLRPRAHSIEEIQRRICQDFEIELDDMLSHSRAAGLNWPRQLAMYLTRELTDATLPAIGRAFGGRNHTTVLHACKRTATRIAEDRDAYDTVRRLSGELGGGTDRDA